MEWVVPIQTFEPPRVRIGQITSGTKRLVPISYTDSDPISGGAFNGISLLLPPLAVKSYDAASGRLTLSLSGQPAAATKLQTLQDSMLVAVRNMQAAWFPGEKIRGLEEVRAGFQPLIEGGGLHLYCPCAQSGVVANDIAIYEGGGGSGWSYTKPTAKLFATGRILRIAIKLHSLSFHQHTGNSMWTGRFRFQHRLLAVMSAAAAS
jgi:hypothetical protein